MTYSTLLNEYYTYGFCEGSIFALVIYYTIIPMNKLITFLLVSILTSVNLMSQSPRTQINIDGNTVQVSGYTDKEVIITGKSNVFIQSTSAKSSLVNSIVRLNGEDAWLYFPNIRPTTVIDSLLSSIYVNQTAAINRTNVRVIIYKHGTAVVAHSTAYKPLTIYNGQNFTGDSASYSLFTYHNNLGSMNDRMRSFRLKKGYMATLATNSDGSGYSRVFIADDNDLEFSSFNYLLDANVSFIRVFSWEYVTKKGWCGSGSGGGNDVEQIKGTWWYSWSADQESRVNQEYVPIKQNLGWPGWDQINNKQRVTHMLGYNEPNRPDQSNMTVAQALAAYPEYLKSGLRIGSPSPSDPFGSNGAWLYEFLDSCKARNWRVDYVAIHAYWAKSPQQWYNDLKYVHERTGKPIWITEWNNGANWTTETWPTADRSYSAANAAKHLNDIRGILTVMDTASFVERYSIYNWVQDARAILLGGNLTQAGEYYMNNKSQMAFNRKKEVIPVYTMKRNPTLSLTFSTGSVTVAVRDDNGDYFRGFILERKKGNGSFEVILDSDDRVVRNFMDQIDPAAGTVKYRARTKLADGSFSNYTAEIGMSTASGGSLAQFGSAGMSNTGWNSVFFATEFSEIPSIVLGSPSSNNTTTLMAPRPKFVNRTLRFEIQATPWSYQNISGYAKDENIPYLVMLPGLHQLGGVTALSGRGLASSEWSTITFSTPFATVPVVFANQLLPGTPYATSLRVRNITTTGFQVRITKEAAITGKPGTETFTFIAMTPGNGVMENRPFKVGITAPNYVGATARVINYGDTISNTLFIAQMQTCNDDTTASLRSFIVSDRVAYVLKQRERSLSQTTTAAETVGWLVMDPLNIISGTKETLIKNLLVSPNPVTDRLYFAALGATNAQISVYNISGSMVLQETLQGNSISVDHLPAGYYFIRIPGYETTRFIKL